MGKEIISGQTALYRVLDGIKSLSYTVAETYGPKGRTVALIKGNKFRLTKDGLTVAKDIDFTDEARNLGAMLIKEGTEKSNYMSGDGSTSTTILAAAICEEAFQLLSQGIDINDLRAGFKKAEAVTLDRLATYKTLISDEKDILNIAKISCNNDEEMANYIKDAFLSIGDNGIVSIADSTSRKGETSVKLTTGFEIDRGFHTSESINTTNHQCIMNDPYILLSSEVFNNVEDLKPIIQQVQVSKRPLLMIAPAYDEQVDAFMLDKFKQKIIEGALVLAPGVSRTNINERLRDISVMTNAKILGEDITLDGFKNAHFGSAGKVIVSKLKTVILETKPDEAVLDAHIASLQSKINSDSTEHGFSGFEIDTMKDRVAKMTGGCATILVGALTSTELEEKKDRYEDALNAVRAALTDGYIPGEAMPLMQISYHHYNHCDQFSAAEMNLPARTAFRAYMKALRRPAQKLIRSSGFDAELLVHQIIREENDWTGFSTVDGSVINLLDYGIIDPYTIIRNAVLYASNVATQFMSISAIVASDAKNLSYNRLDEVID